MFHVSLHYLNYFCASLVLNERIIYYLFKKKIRSFGRSIGNFIGVYGDHNHMFEDEPDETFSVK